MAVTIGCGPSQVIGPPLPFLWHPLGFSWRAPARGYEPRIPRAGIVGPLVAMGGELCVRVCPSLPPVSGALTLAPPAPPAWGGACPLREPLRGLCLVGRVELALQGQENGP